MFLVDCFNVCLKELVKSFRPSVLRAVFALWGAAVAEITLTARGSGLEFHVQVGFGVDFEVVVLASTRWFSSWVSLPSRMSASSPAVDFLSFLGCFFFITPGVYAYLLAAPWNLRTPATVVSNGELTTSYSLFFHSSLTLSFGLPFSSSRRSLENPFEIN